MINYETTKKGQDILRAVNHPLRQSLLKSISENGKMTVTDMTVALRLDQSVCSQHLAILRKAGILETERQGKFINYSVNNPRLEEIERIAGDLIK